MKNLLIIVLSITMMIACKKSEQVPPSIQPQIDSSRTLILDVTNCTRIFTLLNADTLFVGSVSNSYTDTIKCKIGDKIKASANNWIDNQTGNIVLFSSKAVVASFYSTGYDTIPSINYTVK